MADEWMQLCPSIRGNGLNHFLMEQFDFHTLFTFLQDTCEKFLQYTKYISWVSNIESDNSQNVGLEDYNNSRVSNIVSDSTQNVGLEDYNNISVGIFPYFTTPSIKITLG